jgi:hypothetical protein
MSVGLIHEVWKILRPSIETGDPEGAAEILVNYLIEEDYSTTEIKNAFRGDPYIKGALEFYLESPEDGHYHKEDDEDLYDSDFFDDEDYDYE